MATFLLIAQWVFGLAGAGAFAGAVVWMVYDPKPSGRLPIIEPKHGSWGPRGGAR